MLPPDRPSTWPMNPGPSAATLHRGPRRRGSRLARWIPLLLALTVIGAFGGIVAYAYYLVDRKATDGITPLIKAESRPIKIRPDKPGGLDVPHQDKEIYNRFGAGAEPAPRQRAERLLPPPETPMPRPASAPPLLEPPIPPSPDLEPPAGAVVVTLPPSTEPLPRPSGSNGPAPPAPSARPAPATQPPQAPAPTATPAPAPTRPSGQFRLQIAAVQSAEAATGEWNRLKRAHPDLLGALSSNVVRVDRGDGSATFRIQAGPLPDAAAASELCDKLKARKLTCLVVRP